MGVKWYWTFLKAFLTDFQTMVLPPAVCPGLHQNLVFFLTFVNLIGDVLLKVLLWF